MKKYFKPFQSPDGGLVLPALAQKDTDGAIEVEVNHVDDHHEHVVVEELWGCKVICLIILLFPNETSEHSHVGKVRGSFEAHSVFPPLSASVNDGGDDADNERQTLGVDGEDNESSLLVGEVVIRPSRWVL